jgi:hypothetical protein
MKAVGVNPPDREEQVGFTEEEEISWHQYFLDFRELVWPMLEKQGFTYTQALMFWRGEVMIGYLVNIQNLLNRE